LSVKIIIFLQILAIQSKILLLLQYRITFYEVIAMMKSTLTIKDIARELNVSPSTVSRALQGHPGISKETSERIQQYAREHHFKPNQLAAELRSRNSRIIGIIIPEFTNHFFAKVLSGIESAASNAGYRIMVAQSNDDYEREEQITRSFLEARVSGVITSLGKHTTNHEHYQVLINQNIPVVFYDRISTDLPTDRVVVDDYAGAFAAVEYMISTGCRNIYFYSSPPHLEITKNRRNGYLDAMHKHGFQVTPDMMPLCDNRQDAIQLTQEILKQPHRPDGFFAVNDMTAAGILFACKHAGINVPQEISICGFSGDAISETTDPLLTTVEQNGIEVGQCAFQLLHHRLLGQEHPGKMVVKTKLLLRGTTKTIEKL